MVTVVAQHSTFSDITDNCLASWQRFCPDLKLHIKEEEQEHNNALEQLCDFWQMKYPTAGTPYVVARGWGLWCWGWLRLLLLAHYEPLAVRINWQQTQVVIDAGMVRRVELSLARQLDSKVDIAAEIEHLWPQWLNAINQIGRMNEAAAKRMFADMLVAVLVY